MPEYKAIFKKGERVKIKSIPDLKLLQQKHHYNEKVSEEQIFFANRIATVEDFAFYHGGDPLYKLKGLPNVWHEEMLDKCS